MEALVRARALTGFDTSVRALGGDPNLILQRVGLASQDLADPTRWISFKGLLKALEMASLTLGEPAFGIRVQRSRDFSFLGPLLIIAQHAETLSAALKSVSQYLAIQNTGYRTGFTIGETTCVRTYEMSPDLRLFADQFIEESLLSSRKLMSLITGRHIPVVHYSMKHGPLRDPEAYLQDYDAPVFFNQSVDGVFIEAQFADCPIPNRDPNISKFVVDYLRERVLPVSGEAVSETRSLIEALIPMGQAKIEIVAQHLNMHPRTLQRRLDDNGWTFSQILEEQRKIMAERLLSTGNQPLSNIAGHLGYAEQSAFNHAFERWHGVSPSRWRRRMTRCAEL